GRNPLTGLARRDPQPPPDDLLERAGRSPVRDHGAFFGMVCDHLAGQAGQSRWLEKTPTHVYHMAAIRAAIPDARFVQIVRDPRDVLASKKTRRQTINDRYHESVRQRKHFEKAYDPLWDALAWRSAARAGQSAEVTVHYEELVTQPEATVQAVCGALALSYTPALLEVRAANPAEWQRTGTQGISAASVGRWRRVLSPPEVALIQTVTRGWGYAPEPTGGWPLVPVLLVRSGGEFFVRLYRRFRLGGGRFLMRVLRRYAERLRP
ncbi:MAG: sulfotransferase, partial [Anaerolineae bacterium]